MIDIERLKKEVGIKRASCATCENYCDKTDICKVYPNNKYNSDFPFKKDQMCWRPAFENSKFYKGYNLNKIDDIKQWTEDRLVFESIVRNYTG